MGKNKLKKFAEMEVLEHVIQPPFDDIFKNDHPLKGKWNQEVFKKDKPIVLELGCGKGEYTVGMAELFPEKNFLGVDIKGARMWKGATDSKNKGITNVAFLRTRIELIEAFFGEDEISEIWITFPDPQLKKARVKKRLPGSIFLNKYRNFLVQNGIVHLKTDNEVLYEYTLSVAKHNKLNILKSTNDLYSETIDNTLSIQTYYESQFRAQGIPIKYLKFQLNREIEIHEPPEK